MGSAVGCKEREKKKEGRKEREGGKEERERWKGMSKQAISGQILINVGRSAQCKHKRLIPDTDCYH